MQTPSGVARGSGKQRNTSSGGFGKEESDGDSGKRLSLANGSLKGQENQNKENYLGPNIFAKGKENGAPEVGAFDVNKLQKLRAKGGKKTDTSGGGKATKAEPKKTVKKNRVWDDSPFESKLDFTDPINERGEMPIDTAATDQGESMMDKEETVSSDEDDDEVENEKTGTKKKGWFSSMIQSISGNAVLEKSVLQPALKALKDRLMTKNVAEEIAEKLCESVAASLEGKKLGSFSRVSTKVQAAMEEALLRILTPKRSIDILRDVHVAKEQGRPYVEVFVGVNGVGKSANLAKVAYWFFQHNINVMLAACDTFKSGAVEQLRTHARRLQIPVFEKGYEKDPAVVAKEAIQEAKHNSSDVVLVDAAGGMHVRLDCQPNIWRDIYPYSLIYQDNEPLMRALSKLINLNDPDLVLFVSEALVRNDVVDQK